MKRVAVLLCLTLTMGAFGFVHKGKMPKANVPESSQALLNGLQKYQKVVPFVGRQKEKPVEVPLLASNSKAANVIASSVSFVAQNKGADSGRPVDAGSPMKGPFIAMFLACGTFFSFWVAGKRQKDDKKRR